MKPETNNQLHAETLAKYLCGEMSEMETLAFENENMVSEENKMRIETMKKQWTAIESQHEPLAPDTRKAWQKLHNRLHEENLIPIQVAATKRRPMRVFLRIAAVLVILLGVATVIYVNVNSKPLVDMVSVNTGDESNTLIKTLNDGSVIYIAQNSLFTFPKEFEAESRNVSLKGEAFFDIMSNPDKPFMIETDEAFIQVLGTAFNVKTQNGTDFELFVDRGKVKVTFKSNPSHSEFVIAGEKITTVNNNLVKSKNTGNTLTSWYKQRMRFKDESLSNIINVLNRNFNTKFVVAENETGNRKLTVTFQNETVATMTELLCVTLNLKSQNKDGSVVLSENKEGTRQN